ncbi:MAG: DsbA family oxidoreductase [Dehalococcoidia bacterium]
MHLTIASDYICPWCYIGMARADRLQREFELDVTWHPYELHPEFPPEGIDRAQRPPRPEGYVSRLRSLMDEAGLPFQPSQHVPNSHRALEASEFARERGAFELYHRALFDAYFGRGRDIGDIAVLKDLGSEAGLDANELGEAIESGAYAALIDQRTEQARMRGASGTPTFIFEKDGFELPIVGAQEYALFQNVAQRMGARPLAEIS